MTKTEVIEHFGSQAAVARALGLSDAAVSYWPDDKPIPEGRAYKLQVLTRGRLKVKPGDYDKEIES